MKITLKDPRIKKGVIIALPIVFALTAAVAIALLMRPADPPAELPPSGLEAESTPAEVDVVAPVETEDETSPYSEGLSFRSKSDGSCALTGIGSCEDSSVVVPPKSPKGEVLTEVSVGAFADCDTVTEIILPDSILKIGDGAFADCKKLRSIEIGEANPLFSSDDGVLFNKAMTTLLCYPSGKPNSVYTLPVTVERIADGAFSSCPKLKEISFSGTKAEWGKIDIGAGNSALDDVNIDCTSADK